MTLPTKVLWKLINLQPLQTPEVHQAMKSRLLDSKTGAWAADPQALEHLLQHRASTTLTCCC